MTAGSPMSSERDITDGGRTVANKLLVPGMFFLVALVGNIILLFSEGGEERFFFLFLTAATALLLRDASRLKWVSVDENFIYASGWRKKIRIPLSAVESVDVSYMRNPKRITLLLNSPTEFGRKIVFLPQQQRWFESMREGHPLAEELKAMVQTHAESYKLPRP